MNRLDRYIIRNILALTGVVALALVAIYTFTSFVADLGGTGKGEYGVKELAVYTLLNMPAGLHILLPIIAMLGTLMGLGNMAGTGEITAIRAAGVSNLRIGRAALIAGALLGLLGWTIGEWIAPLGQQSAERYKTQARYGVEGAQSRPVWLKNGNDIFNIRRLIAEDHIGDAVIYSIDDELRLRAVTTAQDGRYRDGRWDLSGVVRTEFAEDSARVEQLPHFELTGGLSPQVLRLFVLQAKSLSTNGLMQLIAYLDDNGLDSSEQRLTLWRKAVEPLTVMAMMMFAVPFVFGSLRNSGAGLRLMIGVLVGVGFYVVNEVTADFGQLFGWPPLLAASAPTAALGMIGWLRLRRAI
ncbi:lipopolysaccharide export system permease protein [Hydrocarboniphaga daqingensis]|jgi:lipopolysaccharide export system permease protein|uniref:Lipopolysaccharide export system permease protein n=1 Tax=Hydrocarboniphaga daqingensis TaxID=490188 RepID=A0A1M5S5G2_9GAMM|nr:LPS export ABC transporter permease LptG [Hydrocarboniphaga daqingensis]SHH33734.1 lipopolysaccharide export system permease protein [Hydrocarboniphaga daqingensis]